MAKPFAAAFVGRDVIAKYHKMRLIDYKSNEPFCELLFCVAGWFLNCEQVIC
jgi:hypothetical protein